MSVKVKNEVPSLEDFLKKPSNRFELGTIFDYNENEELPIEYQVKNKKVIAGRNQHKYVLAVIFKYKNKNILILNADEGENYHLVEDCNTYKFPTLSFACLSKFFNEKDHDSRKNIDAIANLLVRGTFSLLDYSEEQTKKIDPEDLTLYRSWVKKGEKGKCPINIPSGFSVVGSLYHKASGVLLKDNRKNGKTMIFGVDEDQYFGCELPTNPTTLKQAFIDLIPKEIRNKQFLRQGEWFCVEISKKDFPQVSDFDMYYYDEYDSSNTCDMFLPIDDPMSNAHHINANKIGIKDKVIYAYNGTLNHGQHESLRLSNYYYFVKNTALRSVSQKGVD